MQDTDLQQDLLAEQDLDLDKCLRIATARETAKRSQDTINTTTQAVDKISAYKEDMKKIQIPSVLVAERGTLSISVSGGENQGNQEE